MFAQTGHVNWIEFLWTLEGFIGICLCLWAFSDAIKDQAVIKAMKINHGMERVAITNIRSELVRLVEQGAVLALGIMAMTIAPSPLPFNYFTWSFTALLFVFPVCTAYNTIESIRLRHDLMRMKPEEVVGDEIQ